MIRERPTGKVYDLTRCLQARFMGQGRSFRLLETATYVFLMKLDAESKKDQELQGDCAHVGDVDMVRDLPLFYVWKEKKQPAVGKQLHEGGQVGSDTRMSR